MTIQVSSIYQGKNALITVTTDSTFTGKVNVKITINKGKTKLVAKKKTYKAKTNNNGKATLTD